MQQRDDLAEAARSAKRSRLTWIILTWVVVVGPLIVTMWFWTRWFSVVVLAGALWATWNYYRTGWGKGRLTASEALGDGRGREAFDRWDATKGPYGGV